MWREATNEPFEDRSNKSVLPSLASMMTVDMVVNDRGNIWILHDKPLPVVLNWVEYDVDTARLSLISQDGEMIDLGMTIHKPLQKPMSTASEIYIVYMSVEEIKDMYILPLMVRNTTQ